MPVVNVTRNEGELTVFPPQVELLPGHSVEWNFQGLSMEELAYIHFNHLDDPEHRPFGPFQCLEPSRLVVRAIGNTGHQGEFRYTALVLNDRGVAARSGGQDKILNQPTGLDTSPEATIHFEDGILNVNPPRLKVDQGQTALWYITGLPPGHFVTFHFDGLLQNEDALVGPFTSVQVARGLRMAQVVTGSNFQGTGPIQYQIRLRRPDGSVQTLIDPVIEPPPGWPPTGP